MGGQTWLGTGGKGWQPYMWWHPAYAAGGVYLAGGLLDHALDAGLVDPVTLGPVTLGPALLAGTVSLAAGVAGGLVGLAVTAGARYSDWARAWLAGGPVVAGAWLAGVAATGPYSLPSVAAAAVGSAAAMLGYRRMRDEQDRHEAAWAARAGDPYTADLAEPSRDPEMRRWDEALAAVGLRGCRAITRQAVPAGFAVLVRLPPSGKTGIGQVAAATEHLERALGLVRDCLDVGPARDPASGRELADRCWLLVDTADILAQTLPMPEDHAPTTVREAFRIGTFMDGNPMMIRLREISALITGVRGRGKTNLLHVIVHQLSRCTDVVLWAIDLKGGRAVKPWLAPWLEGKTARPIFDWVATTRSEAAMMLHAATALIRHRGRRARGGSKLEPSEAHPAVIVLCDELAALVGKHAGPSRPTGWHDPTAKHMADTLTLGVQLGRSECVDYVLFTQRPTATMLGGGDLKSQCELRIGLGVTNQHDANSVFQNNIVNARKLAKLKYKRTRGACLMENGEDPHHLAGKTYFYGDDDELLRRCAQTAVAHAMYPADLPDDEQQVVDAAVRAYTGGEHGYGVGPAGAAAQRWSPQRAAHLYYDLPPEWSDDADSAADPPPAASTPPAQPTATAAAHEGSTPPARAAGRRYYTPRRERTAQDLQAAAADETVPLEDLDAEFAAYLDSLPELREGEEPPLPDTSPAGLSRYELMLQVIEAAGPAGTTPAEITAAMRRAGNAWRARTHVFAALRKALAAGVVVQPAGRYGRYYHHHHAPRC